MRRPGRRAPIGVFDSGLGGLTVLKALTRLMPEESYVYFGDTARVPYGSKSPEAIRRYSSAVAEILAGMGVKLLIVACNTSSAWALDAVRRRSGAPVLGVIEPGASAAARVSRAHAVGVVGTEATIRSGAYAKALRARLPGVRVAERACPLFVPLVEEGWWTGPLALEAARRYCAPLRRARVDTLILGCTHYPFLKPVLRKVMGPRVRLIDSAEETAREARLLLEKRGQRTDRRGRGRRAFYASDAPERFLRLGRRLLGGEIDRVNLRPFEA